MMTLVYMFRQWMVSTARGDAQDSLEDNVLRLVCAAEL